MAVTLPPIDEVIERLIAAGCVAAEAEADDFLAGAPDAATLEAWLCRREQGEPPAWITGRFRFCGQSLLIRPGVYVPRHQSEQLARRAAGLLRRSGRAIDLCTGAGAVAAHLLSHAPTAVVIGVDIDQRAASCALSNGVPTVVADLAAPVRSGPGFDVVTAVAPYVPTDEIRLLPPDVRRYEPTLALDGGGDGLDLVRRVITAARRLLRPGGWLLTEVGADQDRALVASLEAAGFEPAEAWWDDDGDLRGIAAQVADPGRSTPVHAP